MRKLWSTALLFVLVASTTSLAVAQEPNFGRAIALTDAELIIGQPVNFYGPGTVYAYRLDASGAWQEQSRLTASDPAPDGRFRPGDSPLDGNTLVVGAPRKRDGAGVVYVFERNSADGDWRQTAIVEPPAEGDHSEYAAALALAGRRTARRLPGGRFDGVVYRYIRAGGAWTPAGRDPAGRRRGPGELRAGPEP